MIDKTNCNDRPLVGSILKFELLMTIPGNLTPADINFTVWFRNGRKEIAFTKENTIEEEGHWYVYVNTNILGAGTYTLRGLYNIPDVHVPETYERPLKFDGPSVITIYNP